MVNVSQSRHINKKVKDDTYKPPEYYNEGPRKLNILHTRHRHQCSLLNADLSRIHIINNNKCNILRCFF